MNTAIKIMIPLFAGLAFFTFVMVAVISGMNQEVRVLEACEDIGGELLSNTHDCYKEGKIFKVVRLDSGWVVASSCADGSTAQEAEK